MRVSRSWPLVVLTLGIAAPVSGQTGGTGRDRAQAAVRRGSASIAGHVVAGDSGRPLRLARVTATAPELGDGGRVATTDESGTFEFPEVPAGRYTLAASKTGYIQVNFGQRRPLRAGHPIEVGEGQRVRDVDFRLPRGSVITGRVIDQDGEPLVRATVRALRSRLVQGERRIEPGGGAETDDRGVFRIYGLPPGTYFVSAVAQAGDAVQMQRRRGGDPGDGGRPAESLTYMPTYYPGVAALSDAVPIAAPVGEEVPGVDFTLQLVTAARVTGTLLDVNGAPARGGVVQLVPDDTRGIVGQTYGAMLDRSGTFSVLNVPPGRYLALAFGAGGGRGQRNAGAYAVQPVAVSGSIVSDVTLVLAPGITLSGQVTCDGATAASAQDLSQMRIGVWAPAGASLPGFSTQANATPRPDGSFTFPTLSPGARMIRVSGLPQSWALKAVYLDGRDVTDDTIDLKPDTTPRVTVLLSDKATTLTGSVLDERGAALADYTVIAFPADSNLWRPMSRFIQAVRPDRNGTYTIRGLPPGEYLLRAVDDVDQGEWYDPELLQQLREGASHVLLQENDRKSQDLKIVVSSE